jgi:hypothetical protein
MYQDSFKIMLLRKLFSKFGIPNVATLKDTLKNVM